MASANVAELLTFVDVFYNKSIFIGIDVHKVSYHIAVRRADGQMRTWIAPACTQEVVRLVRQLGSAVGAVAYESGPTGFVLARALEAEGLPVIVAAPSRIPRAAAPSAKNDQLDCRKLAQYAAKGLLRPIAIPTEQEEAERTLIRRRDQIGRDIRCCKQRITSLLLEFNVPEPPALKNWSNRAMAALEKCALPEDALFTLHSHLAQLRFSLAQRDSVMARLAQVAKKDHHERVIECLQSVPGVGPLVAAAFRLEVFRPERFRNAEEVASYLGLAPLVRQSGEGKGSSRLRPVGQTILRSLLVEAAWTFCRKDERANALYRRLMGKHGVQQKALIAVARKLAVLLWRLSLEQRPYESRPIVKAA